MNLLMKFLDPQDRTVRWHEDRGRPTTDGVYALLRSALDRDFLDPEEVEALPNDHLS